MDHLIAQLLEMARLDAGRLSLNRAPTDLAVLVRRCVENAQSSTVRHAILGTAPPPPTISANVDALRLEQVLTNLLDNAIKYGPAGGTVDMTLDVQPSAVTISVADRGIGVTPSHRQRIFERIYQAQGGQAGGMGLGLFISRQIAELHGGWLDVEARPGGGSRFVLTLPVPPALPRPRNAAPLSPFRGVQ
ncbi:MAG: sensor histidine kinase [Chloroflexota bacterium]